jgi:hypothetical protein
MELYGHIRAENPTMLVYFKAASEVYADDLAEHVVLLGNIQFFGFPPSLPVTQIADPSVASGEVFVTKINGMETKFFPRWSQADPAVLVEDVGLLCRMPNPVNSSRTLTICNGIHSHGVYGAVRSLTDDRLRELNARYIAEAFPNDQQFGILMRTQVIAGKAMTPCFQNRGTVLHQWPGRDQD